MRINLQASEVVAPLCCSLLPTTFLPSLLPPLAADQGATAAWQLGGRSRAGSYADAHRTQQSHTCTRFASGAYGWDSGFELWPPLAHPPPPHTSFLWLLAQVLDSQRFGAQFKYNETLKGYIK